ncbi:regulator of chromosome condensation 1/beta-lactamase-inhibitor protein II [Dunaliella salina]|uniref:Regulator of chromosome condensation 1/beta-lactamase-inhibitor protein II n=1 Tax=Dunaliella salina TaxID=3046 RepID=A0ABQ7GR84_DUNSA|nr:regulator of chromosome condensation 1/beta-lactamase-inhibitor protein II [Dunaliella salina]|eukprot:KAF5837112.1 regulator of chromosome condensation 1/beta-lactamase-inhibitor protein II [Dunaliella salina]
MADGAPPPQASRPEWKGGALLYAGGTDYERIGRAKPSKKEPVDTEREAAYPNLLDPTRLKVLEGVRIMFVAGGSAAVHCLAGDADGNLYSWGRNEKGQLGHGDLVNRNNPKIVEELKGKHIGQLGIGSIKKQTQKGAEDIHTKPAKVQLQGCTACSAGIDFSMWIANGQLYSAGNPQYGQLGDGSDHAYNAKDSSIAMVYDPQPTPSAIATFAAMQVSKVACGHNHTIAVASDGCAYTWGNGGYGRLGHRVQKDEFEPKKVEDLARMRISVPPHAVVAAGSTSTFCSASLGGSMEQLFSWGKLKTSGDNQMYPMQDQNMTGWNVRCVSCGPAHFAIAADNSTITWGQASNGELGYGKDGKKSSANAMKCEALDGAYTHQVACGAGYTMFLVDPEAAQVKSAPEFECTAPEVDTAAAPADEAGPSGGNKRKGAAGSGGAAKRGKGKK